VPMVAALPEAMAGQAQDVGARRCRVGADHAHVPCRPACPARPATGCRTRPACLAFTSTIRLSTSTCARRPSSLSITARSWRYCGSGAVMMSELVAGSAWICPPVEGWLLRGAAAGRPVALLARRGTAAAAGGQPWLPLGAGARWRAVRRRRGAAAEWPLADMAARSVTASLVASAFFRYTTWMLPLGRCCRARGLVQLARPGRAPGPRGPGWRRARSARCCAARPAAWS
jgi:hypothetical protein